MNEIQINLQRVVNEVLPERVLAGLEDALQLVENKAVEGCPVDDGILRASITHTKAQNNTMYQGVLGSNTSYAPYVHEGTGIYAKDGHGRQTPWRYKDAAGNWHTTKGQKPNPFLQDALDSCLADIPRCFERRL